MNPGPRTAKRGRQGSGALIAATAITIAVVLGLAGFFIVTGHGTVQPQNTLAPPRLVQTVSPQPRVRPQAGEAPSLGNCHMDTCSWSRVLKRKTVKSDDGVLHIVTLLGGTTANGDENPAHIKWEDGPHQVQVLCSLSKPSVTMGSQVDELVLNEEGSEVSDVLMSSFILYAHECHPKAKDLDPDALAKRFGYRVVASPDN